MKLNYKNTIFVGMAFFIICLFWQTYDTIVPKILVEKFGMNQSWSGFVMALDNILALFLLPLFGHLSDKTNTKIGRRTPYIIIGTILAAVFFVGTSFADNAQLIKLQNIENNQVIYDSGVLDNADLKIDGVQIKTAITNAGLTTEDFINLNQNDAADEDNFNTFVKPAREAYAWKLTVESPAAVIAFMVILMFVLLSMSIYRSPAVALMPDITLKPLRSKANAIINLMGAIGGILVIVLGILFKTDNPANTYMSYTGYFATVAAIMVIALVIFLFKVKESKLIAEIKEESTKYGLDDKDEIDEISGNDKLSKAKLRSLLFLLASVFLWFMGYNAVTSKFSVYAGRILNMGYNIPLIIAQAIAIISFIPIGIISSKTGRKIPILAGILMITVSFICAYFITPDSTYFMYIIFMLAGLGWAIINVNSYPMVVELSKGSNVGKYTGFYYTASMAAQIITPILSGILMDISDMSILFPYSAIFIALSFITMLMVKHGDNKPQPKKNLEENKVDIN